MSPSPSVPAARRRLRLAWAALTLLSLFSLAVITPTPSQSSASQSAALRPQLAGDWAPLVTRTTLHGSTVPTAVVPEPLEMDTSAAPPGPLAALPSRETPELLIEAGRAAIGAPSPAPQGQAANTPAGTGTAAALPPAPTAAVIPAEPPLALKPIQSATAKDLFEALGRARRATKVQGLSFAVVGVDGVGWAGTTGTMRDGKTPLTTDRPLVIGSITKTFVAALIMQLVDEGVIRLDQPVNDFLPDLRLVHGVNVQHLLNHTSGVPDLYAAMHRDLSRYREREWSANDVMRHIGPKAFKPGRGYAYSNTNYYLLGLVAEVATRRSVEELLQERFFGPLGLTGADLLSAEEAPAMGIDPGWSTAFWTSGAMVATATDLARWGELLYDGHVVQPRSLRRMIAFSKQHYGLGTQNFALGGHRAHGHSGLLYNYTALMVYLPKERVSVAVIANRSGVDLDWALTKRINGDASLLDLARRFAARD